jgi:hypothetical protein
MPTPRYLQKKHHSEKNKIEILDEKINKEKIELAIENLSEYMLNIFHSSAHLIDHEMEENLLTFIQNTESDLIKMMQNYEIFLKTIFNHKKLTKLHQSTPLSWPTPEIISGARYSGVPQNENVFSPLPLFESIACLLKPKSVILRFPSESRRTFSGFKSR